MEKIIELDQKGEGRPRSANSALQHLLHLHASRALDEDIEIFKVL